MPILLPTIVVAWALCPVPARRAGIVTATPSVCPGADPRTDSLGTFAPFKDYPMRNRLSIALTLLALVGAAPLLGACHATAGAGEDITATGHALTNSAEKNTP